MVKAAEKNVRHLLQINYSQSRTSKVMGGVVLVFKNARVPGAQVLSYMILGQNKTSRWHGGV